MAKNGIRPCDGHCGQVADGHGHISLPDPPGMTRLEAIRIQLDCLRGARRGR
jgi:hypothetical protein